MTYKTVLVKKIYFGFVSVRDYAVKEALEKGWDLKIDYQGTYMTIPHSKLHTGREDPKQNKSKYNEGWYHLIDFPWKEDKPKKANIVSEDQGKLL